MNDRVWAEYLVETSHPLELAAEIMAGEQSSGTFVKVPGETDQLREKFGARVEEISIEETVDYPSLPGSRPPKESRKPLTYQRARVRLSFPAENISISLPNLLTMVAGNLYELSPFSGLRLMDVTVPDSFKDAYPGPQYGIEGTRKLTGVYNRPVVGTIIKPSVGLSPAETARIVKSLVSAGVDFVKDDELIANPPYSPIQERVKAVMQVINDHDAKTGKKVMYAFNITDEIDQMLQHHDAVVEAGGTCVMVSLNSVGLAGIAYLRQHCQLPIHGHRNGWGKYSRHPMLGMEFTAYQKIWRMAGVDQIHVNGLRNKFTESDASVIKSALACQAPLLGGYYAMPVFSSGQWARQVPDTYRALGNVDLMYLAGGGIMGHPSGPGAGVISILQGWEAAVSGSTLEDYAKMHVELREAMEKFGGS